MELYFKVKAQNDLEAKRIARNMAIETLRNKGMMGRWFEVQNVEWIQKGLFGDGVLAKVHVYVKDKKIMKDNQYKKIKAFLAQEFKDVKAMLKKKNFKDFIVSNISVGDFDVFISNSGGTLGYIIKKKGSNSTIEERFGFSTSAEAMTAGKEAVSKLNKDAKIKDADSSEYEGMDLGEMKQLRSELMRKQERERAGSDKFHEYQKQISELTRHINRFRDARIELKMGDRTIGYIEADTLSEAVRRYEEEHPENKGKVNAYMADWSRDAMTRLIDQGYTPREAALRDPDYQSSGTPAMLNEMISFGEKYMRTKREEKRRNRE